jgi:hypothetical protein
VEPDPVIIGGAPRSGVRLLASVLDGHSELASGPELSFVVTLARQWQDIHTTLGENHARNYGLAPECTRENFRSLALQILMSRARAAGKRQFVLHSFAASLSLDSLAALFSTSRFVLMIRDPRDVVRSLLRCDWRNPRDNLRLPYTQDAAAAAKLWHDFTDITMRLAPALEAQGRAILVRYEDLCLRVPETLDRLSRFLGIGRIEPTVNAASARAVVESLGSPHPELRAGIIGKDSVGLGRRDLSAADLAAVESATVTLRQRLGYR